MGRDKSSSVVDSSYRPHGVENVYVTGGSLFPTSGVQSQHHEELVVEVC